MKNIVAFLFVFSSLFASSQTQFIGAPNTTVVARGNFKVDSILYLPKRQKTPTDTGALRYQISDSSLYVWTGNAWRKAKNDGTLTSVSAGTGMSFTTITSTGSVSADTNVLATKSYRQKGDDSLGAIIATKGTGTVTSVGTGYGINGGTITTTGTLTADTLNLATRLRLQKVGDSLGVLISNAGGGTVTGVSAGTGMSFTTITSSGAVNADTLVLSTRARVQKGIDSVSSLIAAKVNISDTATMLSPYAKTSTLGLYLPLTGGTLTGGLTGTTGAFTSSGSGNTFDITHSSGSGIALNISKGGNGEGLYINKTSGSGNAATIVGTLNATTLVKSGGTSTQYLMADGTTSTLTNPVTGTGTTNRSVKFTGTSAVGNGAFVDSATSAQVTITPAGNFGFGTANPQSKLSILSTNFTPASTLPNFILEDKSANSQALHFYLNDAGSFNSSRPSGAIGAVNQGAGIFMTGGAFVTGNLGVANGLTASATSASAYNLSSGIHQFFTNGSLTAGSTFTPTERMRLNSNGLGIGTNAPAYLLDVAGTLRNTTGAAFATSSGNVLIGTTTDATQKLQINGNVRIATIDSTATAMNMLYSDATGVIKKAAVPSGGSGTVTSVATGFGMSGGTITTTGTLIVDSASVATRARVQKGIDSVAAISVKGAGITGYFPKWTGTGTQDTSQLFQLGRNIGIGTASPLYRIHLPDAGNTANQAMLAGTIFGSDGNGQTIVPGGNAMTLYGQGSDGYLYGAQVSGGKWGVNTRTLDATFNVDGSVKIVTVDSTSTARNMLYQDANGVIKKSAGLSMLDDVMTVAGSWVVTKDAGSGYSINNVAYTTNGTTKMVTIDGAFYISAELFSDGSWDDVATIPAGFRPQKTVNWTNNFIVSGAEYETSGGTDFTGALSWTYAQMRVTDEGKVQINGSINTNTLDAGGGDYVVIQFTQTYIIK